MNRMNVGLHDMKMATYLLLMLSLLACQSETNTETVQGVRLNPTLKPNLEYSMTVIAENNSTIEYLDNEELVRNLEESGIDHPITSVTKTVMKSTLKTGQLSEDNEFTLVCTYDTVRANTTGSMTQIRTEENILRSLEGAMAFGKVLNGAEIELDSVTGLADEALRSTLEEGITSMLGQTQFPERMINIGESFKIESPMNFPMANGVMIDMLLINTYRLDSIKASIAYFGIIQEMATTTSVMQSEFQMNGSGSGVLEYNMDFDCYRLFNTELVLNSVVVVNEMKVKTTAISRSSTQTEIRKAGGPG